MGRIESAYYATWTAKQTQQFPVPDGMVGIQGIYVHGANLSKVLVQASDGKHQSTIPARDIAVQTDPLPEDFVELNWRMDRGITISLTPTTSTGAHAHVYVRFARSLSGPEYQIENTLFTSTTTEPFDLVDVPDGFRELDAAFIRGPDLEKVQISLGGTNLQEIPCRHVVVSADDQPFSFVDIKESVSPNTKIKAIAVTHGTGGASDAFFRFK